VQRGTAGAKKNKNDKARTGKKKDGGRDGRLSNDAGPMTVPGMKKEVGTRENRGDWSDGDNHSPGTDKRGQAPATFRLKRKVARDGRKSPNKQKIQEEKAVKN